MTDLYHTSEVTLINADGSKDDAEVVLLCEHDLSIIVNERFVMKLVCTGEYLEELVMGRLLTGGFIKSAEDVERILFCSKKTEASVFLNNEKDSRVLNKLPGHDLQNEWIFALAEQFEKGTKLHDMTSCTHSCMLGRRGEILFTCEDIGRHNAVDKAVGYALKTGVELSECILYTSGRVPVDMAEKSIAAGVPVLVSKSVPTAEAVELANRYALTLIGNARRDSMKVFTDGVFFG